MKIVVVGVSAAGKSTFSRELAKKLNLPITHMDSLMWRAGWNYVGDEKTCELITESTQNDDWIIEGYITKAARANLFDCADKIIYLDYPGWLSAWRYIKRWLKYRKTPRPELPGSPEKFSFKFLKLVYTRGEVHRLEQLFKEKDWDNKIVRLKTPAAAKRYLESIDN